MNTTQKYSILLLLFFIFISCGIEDYIYLNPVPAGSIDEQLGTNARINLPNSSESEYFRYYTIFYRIYFSTADITGSISEERLSSISSSLSQDYFYIKPYTNVTANDTSISPSNIEITFSRRNYYRIAIEEDIEKLLSINANGKLLTLDFLDTEGADFPYLTLDGSLYQLRRSIESSSSDYSFNNQQILSSDNSKDTVTINNATQCYISLYIVKEGMDMNFSRIYSFPTFIGIFKLPS
ncbi:MAG: hypothetical protein LBV20_07130 [Treponema sp.]|jgi:hypothetical protein|nr:hypothetical protein [Treponema sp.]